MNLALGDLNLIVVFISIIQHTTFIAYTFKASQRVLFCLMRTLNKVETDSFGSFILLRTILFRVLRYCLL